MSARLLEGGPVAEAVLDDVRARVDALRAIGITPGLGTILVGDDGASGVRHRAGFGCTAGDQNKRKNTQEHKPLHFVSLTRICKQKTIP